MSTTHRREIGSALAEGWYFDACSCGWESAGRTLHLLDLQRYDSAWREHVAEATTADARPDHVG